MHALSRSLLLALSCVALASCKPNIAKLSVKPAKVELTDKGQSVTLKVDAQDPSGNTAYGAKFTYTSSAPNVATVDTTGKVTAIDAGSTTVSVHVVDSEAKTDVPVMVTLPAPPPPPVDPNTMPAAGAAPANLPAGTETPVVH